MKSICFPFDIDQGLGTLREENNYEEHVKQLIRQVLLTSPGERINRPDFGCGLRDALFAPYDGATSGLLEITVVQALYRWLSTVISVENVTASAVEDRLEVVIIYKLLATQQSRQLNLDITP